MKDKPKARFQILKTGFFIGVWVADLGNRQPDIKYGTIVATTFRGTRQASVGCHRFDQYYRCYYAKSLLN